MCVCVCVIFLWGRGSSRLPMNLLKNPNILSPACYIDIYNNDIYTYIYIYIYI